MMDRRRQNTNSKFVILLLFQIVLFETNAYAQVGKEIVVCADAIKTNQSMSDPDWWKDQKICFDLHATKLLSKKRFLANAKKLTKPLVQYSASLSQIVDIKKQMAASNKQQENVASSKLPPLDLNKFNFIESYKGGYADKISGDASLNKALLAHGKAVDTIVKVSLEIRFRSDSLILVKNHSFMDSLNASIFQLKKTILQQANKTSDILLALQLQSALEQLASAEAEIKSHFKRAYRKFVQKNKRL
jgi:hypothetical protein